MLINIGGYGEPVKVTKTEELITITFPLGSWSPMQKTEKIITVTVRDAHKYQSLILDELVAKIGGVVTQSPARNSVYISSELKPVEEQPKSMYDEEMSTRDGRIGLTFASIEGKLERLEELTHEIQGAVNALRDALKPKEEAPVADYSDEGIAILPKTHRPKRKGRYQ